MKILIPTLLILMMACDSKPKTGTLTGDLYFRFFRLGSYYNKPDSVIQQYEMFFDTLKFETADGEQRKFLSQYKRLKDEKLLYKPFVEILSEKDSVVTLYLDQGDYDRIKIYKLQSLRDDHKKVEIEADVYNVDNGLFYCVKLKRVELVDGETWMKPGKWKIDDYN